MFAALALVIGCAVSGRLSAVWVLVAGGLSQLLAAHFNTGRLGNALALWLSMRPKELFFYVFLPPLLLDAAVRTDFFLFQKVK